MYCKKCLEFIRGDCLLENNICVFCYYNINEWDSNGIKVLKSEAIVNYYKCFNDWRKEFTNYYKDLTKQIKKLPKGSIIKKHIKGHIYYYLVYRENKKIKFDYLGNKIPKILYEQIKFRKKLTKNLKILTAQFNTLKLTKRSILKINRFHIFQRDNFTCQYCGKTRKNGTRLEIDHIIPKSKGGKDTVDNLITSCSECNLDKMTIDID